VSTPDHSMQEVQHEPVWYGKLATHRQGLIFRRCQICGASEDVHIQFKGHCHQQALIFSFNQPKEP